VSILAAVLLAAATGPARVEAVSLTTVESRLAVRVVLSGRPGLIAVHREADAARVSVEGARLGTRFTGGQRFSWTPAGSFDPALLAEPTRLDRLEVVASPSEVSVRLHVPPEVTVDVRRDRRGLLLLFRQGGTPAETTRVAAAPPPATSPGIAPTTTPSAAVETRAPEKEPTPAATAAARRPAAAAPVAPSGPPPQVSPGVGAGEPEPAVPAPAAPASTPPEPAPPVAVAESTAPPRPSPDTAELARSLFSGAAPAAEEPGPETRASVSQLYDRLFPGGTPQVQPETVVRAVEPVGPEQGVVAGPFRVQLAVDARYVDADTFVESSGVPVRDRYLELAPRVTADAPVSEGRLTLGYRPALRAFATYDEVNSSSHRLSAEVELPAGPSVRLRAKDSFVSGVLDTREVDPGGEYFFDLGRFHRNTLEGGASVIVGPRTSLEVGGSLNSVRFREESSFFDYDSRLASAGVGYELTPTLKGILSYAYDQVPTPAERPLAETKAHSGQVSFYGDLGRLLSGSLSFGYRSQNSPNAGPEGRQYRGVVMSGSLTRQLGPESTFSLYLNRSTPVSAFEENAFYVSTGIQGAARVPLFLQLQLQGGLGYQWNDYRTVAEELGAPREDRILALYVGLRRPIRRQFFVSATYRREERLSNLDRFDTNTDGFFLQLEWDIFGSPSR